MCFRTTASKTRKHPRIIRNSWNNVVTQTIIQEGKGMQKIAFNANMFADYSIFCSVETKSKIIH